MGTDPINIGAYENKSNIKYLPTSDVESTSRSIENYLPTDNRNDEGKKPSDTKNDLFQRQIDLIGNDIDSLKNSLYGKNDDDGLEKKLNNLNTKIDGVGNDDSMENKIKNLSANLELAKNQTLGFLGLFVALFTFVSLSYQTFLQLKNFFQVSVFLLSFSLILILFILIFFTFTRNTNSINIIVTAALTTVIFIILFTGLIGSKDILMSQSTLPPCSNISSDYKFEKCYYLKEDLDKFLQSKSSSSSTSTNP